MKYTIKTSSPRELTRDELKQMRRLSFRSAGYMFYDIMEMWNYNVGKVISVREPNGRLVGWSILVPTKQPRGATFQGLITNYGKRKCKYEAQFYVRVSERGKGIGAMLMREVQKYGRPWVYPSNSNASFFAKYPVSCEDSYRKSYINGYKRRRSADRKRKASSSN